MKPAENDNNGKKSGKIRNMAQNRTKERNEDPQVNASQNFSARDMDFSVCKTF